MANRQLPGQVQAKTISGAVDKVPCPHCGKHNDFRPLQDQQLLDTGSDVQCDVKDARGNVIGCGKLMQVAAVRTLIVVAVRPSPNAPRGDQARVAPARTVGPGALRRLLGGK